VSLPVCLGNCSPSLAVRGLHGSTAQEVKMTLDRIAEQREPGQPCQECGLPLLEAELYCITTVSNHLGKAYYITCHQCGSTSCSNINAGSDHHFVSNEAAVYVDNHMASYQAPAPQRRLM
jgi:hypothetical protein